MAYTCPVCAYDRMVEPPVDFAICPSCGTEFGYDDANRSFDELRTEWIDGGAQWFSHVTQPPDGWSGYRQLLRSGYALRPVASRADSNTETSVLSFGHAIRVSSSAA
jgi:hypothetical protein